MKVKLVRVGNSKGVRIPKPVIAQCGFGTEVEMRVEGRNLVISRGRRLREGWADAFAAMNREGEDRLEDWAAVGSRWDDTDWQW